jgi:hypothetical protein
LPLPWSTYGTVWVGAADDVDVEDTFVVLVVVVVEAEDSAVVIEEEDAADERVEIDVEDNVEATEDGVVEKVDMDVVEVKVEAGEVEEPVVAAPPTGGVLSTSVIVEASP